jgi:hypothetical protein
LQLKNDVKITSYQGREKGMAKLKKIGSIFMTKILKK